MPRDLFGDVTDPSITLGTRKWYTVPLSLAAHAAIVLAIVIVPLFATGTLPLPSTAIVYVPAVSAPLPPPPVARVDAPPPSARRDAAPIEAPEAITPEPSIAAGFENAAAVDGGIPALSIVEGSGAIVDPPAPPEPPPDRPIPVGGQIKAPEKIRDAHPVYPPIAQAAHVEGVVIIEATIGVDGRVERARVLRSAPLLDDAALAAVRQWVYSPTRLNGVPVSVVMTVTVRFQLR